MTNLTEGVNIYNVLAPVEADGGEEVVMSLSVVIASHPILDVDLPNSCRREGRQAVGPLRVLGDDERGSPPRARHPRRRGAPER